MHRGLKTDFISSSLSSQSSVFVSPPQILSLYDSVDALDVDKVVEYVKGLQQEDGSFAGDKWGEAALQELD